MAGDRLDKTLISASPRLRNRMPVWRSVLAADVGSSEKRSPPHLRPCPRRPYLGNFISMHRITLDISRHGFQQFLTIFC